MALSVFSFRYYRYQFYRILRSGGSPDYVARSVFCGVLAGTLVPFFQIPIAIALAFSLKANKTIAALSTFISNPFTYPIMWSSSLYVGSFFVHGNLKLLMKSTTEFTNLSFWTENWAKLGFRTLLMFIVGGLVIGIPLSSIAYFVTKKRIEHRLRKLREKGIFESHT